MSLTLCNYPFGQKYAERCEEALKFLLGLVSERIELIKRRTPNEVSSAIHNTDQMTGELKENLGSQSQAKLDETAKVLDQLEGKMTPDDYTRFANIKDRLGRSVLHLACQHGVDLQMIKDLVEKCGAKTDLEDMEG